MIRINAIPNNAAAKAYYRSADYHMEGQEQPAFWRGKGAEMLGLTGEVKREDFEALCDNLNPNTGKQLTAKTIQNRRVGYDLTFSVPKSVSLAFAVGGDERIADAFRVAVAETMGEVEREMKARVRKRGSDYDRDTGNIIWTDFLHTTSRPINGEPDPQLHIHAVVFNATYDREESQWKAGQFGGIKADGPYFQAVFRARLANQLQDLGYELKAAKGDFEIVGVPKRAVKEFSRRTDLIEKLAGHLGVTRPETKAKLGATSREKKTKGLTWDDLLERWSDRLAPEELAAIKETVTGADTPLAREERDAEAVSYAVSHLTERRSVVDQRAVVTEALKFDPTAVTPEGIVRELARPGLIRRQMGDRTMLSTQGVLSEEKRLLAFAKEGRGRYRPLSPPRKGKPDPATPAVSGQPLTASQRAAYDHILTSPDRLMVVRGVAGSGKSTLLQAVMPRVEVPWVILAPTAAASRGVLRRDGFKEADTLATFLNSKDAQHKVKGGLIVLDEASLAGSHDMARLIHAAEQLNARVLLLGDRRQHKSVSRGDVLALIEDKAGLPVVEVSEIKRQSGQYKAAVELLARGNVAAGFDRLDAMGWVKEPENVTASIADDYLAAVRDEKSALVVSPTHAAGDAVTAEIRARLRQDERLKGDDREFTRLVPLHYTAPQLAEAKKHPEEGVVYTRFGAYRRDTLGVAEGDLLRTTNMIKDASGKRIDNGSVMTVTGFTSNGDIRVKTANGSDRILAADVGHLTHGYVVTSHAAQGKTVDRVLIDMTAANFPAVGKEQFYVSVSRGRQQATVFTDHKPELRDAIERTDTRLLASDLVRKPKHGIRKRLRRHLAFLTKCASIARDAIRGKEQEYARQ
jgi:conjugative relaxase-like TrwC/TraI family protein